MSLTATPAELLPLEAETDFVASGPDAMVMEERSKWQPLFFALPALIATVGAFSEMTLLTDVAFLLITVFCTIFLIGEFRAFSYRWGIGGMLAYGGTLVWFCWDYMTNWFGIWAGQNLTGIPGETVARAGMHHALFIMCLSFGLRLKLKGYFERFFARFPNPANDRVYIILILLMTCIGFSPYMIFTQEGLFKAFWNDFMGGRAGGALWTVGRTGNANYSFGAYLAQVMQVGTMGAILGSFYAVLIAKSWPGRIFGMLIWLPTAMLSFGSGTRGSLVMVALPLVGFVFIRFQAQAAAALKRVSLRGYMSMGLLLLGVLTLVQIQITFRNSGFRDARVEDVLEQKVAGNNMFSESLNGFYLIPNHLQPFYDRVPGESIIMPMADTAFWFFVSPIPRAVWTTKPLDPVWLWYNYVVAGTEGTEGTTISNGGVGCWYFRYGIMGTIQGGLFIGFLMGFNERLLREYAGIKPIIMIAALANATFLFRCYRGLSWVEYHGSLVGLTALAFLIWFANLLLGGGGSSSQQSSD